MKLGAHEHHGGSIDPDAELGTSGHRTLDEEDPILEAMEAIEFDIEDQKRKAKEKRMSVLGVEDDDGRRMPVLVAVGFTISWIFMCAGLFKWMEVGGWVPHKTFEILQKKQYT
jgi:hypothetical protein